MPIAVSKRENVMTLKDVIDIAPIVGAIGSWVVGICTIFILYKTTALARASKQADIVMGCDTRYDVLWELRNDPSRIQDTAAFYNRFWSLQLNQFFYWKEGFIPDDIYLYWLTQRNREWKLNRNLSGIDFREGWDIVKRDWQGSPTFEKFMSDAMTGNPSAAIDNFRKNAAK